MCFFKLFIKYQFIKYQIKIFIVLDNRDARVYNRENPIYIKEFAMSNQPKTLAELDPNLAVNSQIKEADIVYYDVRNDPFRVYGLYNYKTEPVFRRIPQELANQVNEGVVWLSRHTAGGRVRFSSDSRYVAVHAVLPEPGKMSHMALTGSTGFDLYVDDPDTGISRFYKSFTPPFDIQRGDALSSILYFKSRKLRHFTIHFPLYSEVSTLHIGLQSDATVGEGMKYRDVAPFVCYGSSVTQGGCASRPGNVYSNILSCRLGIDHINLGFSGSGCGEDNIVEYMAGLNMSAFICDYDHNAPTVEHLKKTHERMYRTIRAAHPDIPYIMVSRVGCDPEAAETIAKRDVIYESYRHAIADGDQNVYFIDGQSVLGGIYENMCTVDSVHATDVGFALMADAIGNELKRALTQDLFC